MTVSSLLQDRMSDKLRVLGYNLTGSYEKLPEQVVNAIYNAVQSPSDWPEKTTLGPVIRTLVQNQAFSEYLVKCTGDGMYICKLEIDEESSLFFRPVLGRRKIDGHEVEYFQLHDHPGVTGAVRRFFQLQMPLPNTVWEFIEENAWIITEKPVNGRDEYIRMWDHQSFMEDCRAGQNGKINPIIWSWLLEIERSLLEMDFDDPCWVRYDKEF